MVYTIPPKDPRDIDPFDFVEPCEPECTSVRHAYHQGQWDMAVRIKEYLEKITTASVQV